MSFVVEDGTAKSTSTSYVSVAAADTYHSEHGAPATWTAATTAQKEAALMAATVWMDATYSWRGSITDDDQALGWPREDVYDDEGRDIDDNIVPQAVQDCCAYLALQHLSTALDSVYARGGDVKRQKVDTLEVEYFERADPRTWMPYAKQIVSRLIQFTSGQATLNRA